MKLKIHHITTTTTITITITINTVIKGITITVTTAITITIFTIMTTNITVHERTATIPSMQNSPKLVTA